mgnify:CR=1 FL=1
METTITPRSLGRPGFLSDARAFLAVVRREWTIFTRYPSWIIALFIWPLIFPMMYILTARALSGPDGSGLAVFIATTGATDYIGYIIVGATVWMWQNIVLWGMGFALKNDMDSGVLESNWLAPISRLLILVGRTLTSMLTTTITSIVMLVIAGALFGFKPTGSAFAAILTAIPMLIGLYGFGFAFAGTVLLMREANTLIDVGSFLVQGFSGTNFPVQSLPYWLIPISLMLPLTYGLDAVRGLLLKTNTLLPIKVEIIILVVFMFVMLWIGAQVFYRIERRVRTLGTLGQH